MRPDGRGLDQLRPTHIEINALPYAEGSALITAGDTRVLCAASVEERVPQFRKGSGRGWVTAEYAMLPRATLTRSERDGRRGRVDGRVQEIQRLIGRSLRAAVDFSRLGERSIYIDCDVLVADGGTRTASITGGYVALALAVAKLRAAGLVTDTRCAGRCQRSARGSSPARPASISTTSKRSEERRVGKECRSRWSPYH